MHKKYLIPTAFPSCFLHLTLLGGNFPSTGDCLLASFSPGGKPMVKQSEQTHGQQLLKQLRDGYRRPQTSDFEPEAEEHTSGSLPDPEYWPVEISRAIN